MRAVGGACFDPSGRSKCESFSPPRTSIPRMRSGGRAGARGHARCASRTALSPDAATLCAPPGRSPTSNCVAATARSGDCSLPVPPNTSYAVCFHQPERPKNTCGPRKTAQHPASARRRSSADVSARTSLTHKSANSCSHVSDYALTPKTITFTFTFTVIIFNVCLNVDFDIHYCLYIRGRVVT